MRTYTIYIYNNNNNNNNIDKQILLLAYKDVLTDNNK